MTPSFTILWYFHDSTMKSWRGSVASHSAMPRAYKLAAGENVESI
jgi:hypothetical protein